jgi:hypothetical protein
MNYLIQHPLCCFKSGNILSLRYRIHHSNMFGTIPTYYATISCITQNPYFKLKITWSIDEDCTNVTTYNKPISM